MASIEIVISECEWHNLHCIQEHIKELFDVEIRRKDALHYNGIDDEEQTPMAVVVPSHSRSFPCIVCQNQTILTDSDNTSCNTFTQIRLSKDATCMHNCMLQPPPIIVLIVDKKNSPGNLEKCRRFTYACTPSHKDFKILTLQLDDRNSFEVVQANSANIEQRAAALINAIPEQLVVTIQGHQTCVDEARDEIKMVLNELDYNFMLDDADEEYNTTNITSNALKNDVDTRPNLSVVGKINVKSPFPQFTKPSSKSIPHVVDDNENSYDSEETNILADARFEDYIIQATTCGFEIHEVVNVFKRLGADCSMDDMMRELMKERDTAVKNDAGLEKEDIVKDSDDSEEFDVNDSSNLRPIIIDGSNVAMSHGQKIFSCKGIQIVVDWFKNRGHEDITVFVPLWRKEASRPDAPIMNQEILTELESERIVVFTPSRRVGGTRIVCYDDRYVLIHAAKTGGIVVSNDVYRDLVREQDEFREVVEKRLLMYSFVKDTFMPPEDPLGRQGPSLDNFLRIKPAGPKNRPQNCPYGKKCTYGNKCRYYHPERRHASRKMVAETLKENAEAKLRLHKTGKSDLASLEKRRGSKPKLSRTISLVPQDNGDGQKKPLLQHSKSLVFPKSTSYLTESRVKMEQAESAQMIQSMSVSLSSLELINRQISIDGAASNNDGTASNNNLHSNSCSNSSSTSPTPVSATLKSKVNAVKSFPSTPLPNLPPYPTSTSASLSVANTEQTTPGYFSGHLLVAKKLSEEENKSGKFFSNHTSRPLGTSQSDANLPFDGPILSLGSRLSLNVGAEQKAQQAKDADGLQLPDSWKGPSVHWSSEVPNQTGYQIVSSNDRSVISPPTPSFVSPEDHQFTMTSVHSSSLTSPDYKSCPQFTQKDDFYQAISSPSRYQRSLSSTSPIHPSDYMPTTNRKFSLASQTKVKPHLHMQPQLDPTYYHPVYRPPPLQCQLLRQRVSVDNEISSGLLGVGSMSSILSPTEDSNSPFNDGSVVSNTNPPPVFPATQMVGQTPNQPMGYQPVPGLFEIPTGTNPGSGSIVAPSSPWQYSPSPYHNGGMGYGGSPFQDQNTGGTHLATTQSSIPQAHQQPYHNGGMGYGGSPFQDQNTGRTHLATTQSSIPQAHQQPYHNGGMTYGGSPFQDQNTGRTHLATTQSSITQAHQQPYHNGGMTYGGSPFQDQNTGRTHLATTQSSITQAHQQPYHNGGMTYGGSPFQDQNTGRTHLATTQSSIGLPLSHQQPYSPPPMYTVQYPPQSQQMQRSSTYPPNYVPNRESHYYPSQGMSPVDCGTSNYNYNHPSTPTSQYLPVSHINSPSKVINEEAQISTNDPRFFVYQHLSQMLGEQVVRKFMNRNPDVKNFNELFHLISSYKKDTEI